MFNIISLTLRWNIKTFLVTILIHLGFLGFSQQNKIIQKDTLSCNKLSKIITYSTMNLKINEFMASNSTTISDENGEFDDWIEIYNFGSTAVNIKGLFITDNKNNPKKWMINDTIIINAGKYKILWADNDIEQGPNHLGFKLSSSGEHISIYTPDNALLIDSINFGQQVSDYSYGRYTDGSDNWFLFENPTPGNSNLYSEVINITKTPQVNKHPGFYTNPFSVELSTNKDNVSIYYTIGTEEPDRSSTLYNSPINITDNTIIRARAYKDNYLPSKIVTFTYLFNENTKINVISLVTTDENMFGNSGIYKNPFSGIEKPIHFEYFSADGNLEFALNGGIKIHAPDGRSQKSLRFYARSQYGQKEINYKIFPDKNINRFKRLILRNGANDGLELSRTHIRDPLTHILYKHGNENNAMSSYLPVHVYLNGNYWGIYNLRERQDKTYIRDNFYPSGDFDFLEYAANAPELKNAIVGDWTEFNILNNYVIDNDLSESSHYLHVSSLMDIDNFIDYQIYEIFIGNQDWLSNNIKFWKPKEIGAKWKWVLWDTEYGLGCYSSYPVGQPDFNFLHMAMSWGGWGNGDYTYLLRNLMDNPEFKEIFNIRFADLLNTELRENALIHELINDLKAGISDEVPRQTARWGGTFANWSSKVENIKDFTDDRPFYIRQHIINEYNLTDTFELIVNISPQNTGEIKVNTITENASQWTGIYFTDYETKLEAIPNLGYKFSHWENIEENADFSFITTNDTVFTAVFIPEPSEAQLIINEINYNSSEDFNPGDWVELYNPMNYSVDISNWSFKDEDDSHEFIIPKGEILEPHNFLILCEDHVAFNSMFPEVKNYIGDFGFGLSGNGELLRLYNYGRVLIDQVPYEDNAPWPTEPDGTGPTLELKDFKLDNFLAESWESSDGHGSPNENNENVIIFEKENKELNNSLIKVYPNPFSSFTNVSFNIDNISNAKFIIFDQLGKEVLRKTGISSRKIILNSVKLQKGFYIGKFIMEGHKSAIVKLIVK